MEALSPAFLHALGVWLDRSVRSKGLVRHPGQAAPSVNRLTGLSDIQQEELIAFLNTLRAPSVLGERPGEVKGRISNSSATDPAFGILFKLGVARLNAGSFPAASNSS